VRNNPSAGFTLIEVLVALVILGLAFGVAIPTITSSLWRGADNRDERNAIAYAQSLLSRVGTDIALVDGTTVGQDGRLSWRLDITPGPMPGDAAGLHASLPTIHHIEVQVRWQGHLSSRRIDLDILKLSTAP